MAREHEMARIKLGLTGWPLKHSFSPILHQAALVACGLDGEYDLYPVPPMPVGEDALGILVNRVRSGEIHGLNLTIPHKQEIIRFLDDLTPEARAIGAVNVLYMRRGRLWGDNTDAPGFLADLSQWAHATRWSWPKNRCALVLGAGGAARAVIYALCSSGWQVLVAARREEQARQLARDLNASLSGRITAVALDAILPKTESMARCDLIVNTTPIGMAPDVDAMPWPSDIRLMAPVYDIIAVPRETALVRRARAEGWAARGGIGMLLEQAALAFERWTGRSVPRAALWKAMEPQDGPVPI